MLTKYTNCEVIEVKSVDEKIEGNTKLSSFDHIPKETYRTNDGYIYVKVRAISSRVNKNFDGWPVNELAGMDEGDFKKLTSEIQKEAAPKEINKYHKELRKRGFNIEVRPNGHFRIWHPNHGQGLSESMSSTPKNPEDVIDRVSRLLAKKFPREMAGFVWKGRRYASISADRMTFTKDSSSLKSKGDYGFKTFIGRPVFIDHNNSDPQRARGVVVDAMLHIEHPHKVASDSYWSTAPDNHKPETWIELLLEVDGKSFPKLAKALLSGKVNAVSMGCNVEYTLCSICNHKAATVDEYCDHVRKKGTTFKTGSIDKVAYEDCYNVNFFEISAVFDPADVTALFTEPVIKHAKTSAKSNLLQKAFGAGEAHESNPVAAPEFDSVKMANYLGIEPHDPDMHSYMKAYEEGIEYAINNPNNLKAANTESQSLEDNFDKSPYERVASMNTEKYGESITAPSKVDTLKSDKPCPIGLAGECGLDDESGRCEKCGYREAPSPLGDPDLSKAKAFDRQKEKNKDKFRDETKSLIDQLKRTLSKNEIRSVNSTMDNKKAKITLAADVEEVPGDEHLAELGWTVPEKESSASSNSTPLTEDGKPVSDRPSGEKVISDQLAPVESATKIALGELPGLNQPNGGEGTPQFKGDKNNESSGISEHQPGETTEQYQSVKKEVEQPQYADEGYTQDIKGHNPSTMPEQYQSVKKEVEKPQFSGEGGTSGISEHHAQLPGKGRESAVLSAIKLADLEVELGLNEAEMKYARVAELENEEPSIVEAKYETLVKIKEAGLGKKEAPAKKLASFPSFKGVKESSATTSTVGGVPDDAIFN